MSFTSLWLDKSNHMNNDSLPRILEKKQSDAHPSGLMRGQRDGCLSVHASKFQIPMSMINRTQYLQRCFLIQIIVFLSVLIDWKLVQCLYFNKNNEYNWILWATNWHYRSVTITIGIWLMAQRDRIPVLKCRLGVITRLGEIWFWPQTAN